MLENLTLCVPRLSSGQSTFRPTLAHSVIPNEIPENHVVIKVERFGFSANNVTYQALGEAPHFRYFDFHASPDTSLTSAETHGVIPVWGFGTVVKSTHPRIQAGERVYGYLAPARYLLLPVSPSDVNKFSFAVPRPHLPADRRPYNQITRCRDDIQYDPSPFAEDFTMLYRPLFWTAFWCEDWLRASAYRGASRVLISSASAKTAFCLAYLINKRAGKGGSGKIEVIGLTSGRNVDFTRDLGLYDQVIEYDGIEQSNMLSSANHTWLYIDVTGNDDLNSRIQRLFLKHPSNTLIGCIQLGLTNLRPTNPLASTINFSTNTSVRTTSQTGANNLIALEQFFMPEWLAVRRRQLTVSQITTMQVAAWRNVMQDGSKWVNIVRVNGPTAVKKAYHEVVGRGLDPKTGMIWSLWEENTDLGREISPKL